MKNKLPSYLLLLFFLLGIASLIFTVGKRQELRTRASASTVVSFSPSSSFETPIQIGVNEPASLDIMLDPGTNRISTLKLSITYDTNKFLDSGDNTLVINKSAFPSIIEGPVVNVNSGTVKVALSIGIDPTLAIKSLTKVATLHLIAKTKTNTDRTKIFFETATQAYSVASSDHAFENVISTAIPAYFIIGSGGEFSGTPTPGTTNQPTFPPVTIVPTIIPSPTAIPTPTPTPLPNSAVLNIGTMLHGIGSSGDNTNPTGNSLSNKDPQHVARKVLLSFFDAANTLLGTKEGLVLYDRNAGMFNGTVDIGANVITTGDYILKIKSDSYLQKLIPGTHHVLGNGRTTLPTVSLVTGDINGDNTMNVLDYNLLMDCYTDIGAPKICPEPQRTLSDLNDDLKINQGDYNLFVREIAVQNGD